MATLVDGEQVFVKAIEGSPDAVGDHRAEIGVSARLPAAVPAPRLRFGLERDARTAGALPARHDELARVAVAG